MDGYVDCGLKAMPNLYSFAFETWFMPRAANEGKLVPDTQRSSVAVFTLASIGEVDNYEDSIIHEGVSTAPFSIALVIETSSTGGQSSHLHIRMPTNESEPWVSVQDEINPNVAKWYHLVVSVDPDGISVFLNGRLLKDRHSWVGLPEEGYLNHNYPLLLGASCTRWDPQAHAAGLPIETQANWLGYIKLSRIWNSPLDLKKVQTLYDPTYETEEMSTLYLYADLDSPTPMDLTQTNEIRCSSQTEYQQDVACLVEAAQVFPATHRITRFHMAELASLRAGVGSSVKSASFSDHGFSAAALAMDTNDYTPFFEDLKDKLGEWFELIDCAAAVIFIVLDTLAGLKVKKAKLANVFYRFFGKKGVQAAGMLQKLFAAAKEVRKTPLVNAAVDFAYFIHDSGVLKEILSCFAVSFFGILKLFKRFIPWVGWAALVADLMVGAGQIGFAVARYVHRTQAKPQPLALLWTPDPRTEKFLINAGGRALEFTPSLDHRPADSQRFLLNMSTEPAGVLTLNNDKAMLSQDNWQSGAKLMVQATSVPADGQARILSSDGIVLISFEVAPVRTLAFVQDNIVGRIGSGGKTIEIEYDLIWTGPQEEEPGLQINVLDTGGNKLPIKVGKRAEIDRENILKEPDAKRTRKSTGNVSITGQPANIVATCNNNLVATATIKVAGIDEWVTIFMCNAGIGDAFYIHHKKREEKVQGTDTKEEIHQSTMIVDGGASKASAANMWACVSAYNSGDCLPIAMDKITNARAPLDLVIVSHQDNDHINGILSMYDQMSQGKPVDGTRSGVFPGASTVRPAMTWTNNAVPPQRRRSVPVSPITRLQSLSLADKPEGMILSGTADAEHSSPQSPTRIKDWYYELLKGATEAQNLIDICENQKWNWVATPLLTTAVPGGIISAGGKLTNLGPSKKIVEDAEIVTGATAVTKMANNTSIVEDMSGQTYNEWHCLWTGDAGSKRGYGEKGLALQNALGIAELSGSSAKSAKSAPQKHYLLMKVPHHGSEASNSPGFFAAVTADHYLIAGNCRGQAALPREECIQWILDGHAAMRAVAAANNIKRDPPKIWINNPLPQDFTFNYQDGEIFCRNSATPGEMYNRDLTDGCLIFKIHNGNLSTPEVMTAPSTQTSDRNKAVPYVNRKRSVRGSTAPAHSIPADPWIPLFPPAPPGQSNTTAEWKDILAHMPSMYANRITCSMTISAKGKFVLFDNPNQVQFHSELEDTFQTSNIRSSYSMWPRSFTLWHGAPEPFATVNLASITTHRSENIPPESKGDLSSSVIRLPNEGSRVTGVKFHCPVWKAGFTAEAIQGIELTLQDGSTIRWPQSSLPDGTEDKWFAPAVKEIPSPGKDFALVGFRWTVWNLLGQPEFGGGGIASGAFITSLGAIWRKMD